MLVGAKYDLLINTTSMPSHYPVSKKAIKARWNDIHEHSNAELSGWVNSRHFIDLSSAAGSSYYACLYWCLLASIRG
ncbi:MAG TPA: hypothetical protein P5055_23320 [Candidatus Paceibacterota bacterium]|nr:hypothetical protein [Candidatus Paceibacterota bacterium]